jgi:hypothetical protein
MIKNNGSWIFISHSSDDIEKIRIIRNEFEKYGQNPLAFYLRCLNTDTEKNIIELYDLIQREIEARDWFVYCESESARKSEFVKMERDYVQKCEKVFIWRINLDDDIEKIKQQVRDICCSTQVFVISSHRDYKLSTPLIQELKKNDFSVWEEGNYMFPELSLESLTNYIRDISKRGFTLFLCTKETVGNRYILSELEAAKKNNSTIITFVFDVKLPEEMSQILPSKNIYNIPAIPKEEDYYLLVDLVKAALKKKIDGFIQLQADAFNAEAKLQEKLNYQRHFHRLEAVHIRNLGACDDYVEVYQFPCCNKYVIVGDGPISRFRCDGCCTEER